MESGLGPALSCAIPSSRLEPQCTMWRCNRTATFLFSAYLRTPAESPLALGGPGCRRARSLESSPRGLSYRETATAECDSVGTRGISVVTRILLKFLDDETRRRTKELSTSVVGINQKWSVPRY